MTHPIHRVTDFEIVADYTLRVRFDDGTEQMIDFRPILAGEVFGPLWDLGLFNRVQIDPEAHTLVRPNDADLDPATLHDWPVRGPAMTKLARSWERKRPRATRG